MTRHTRKLLAAAAAATCAALAAVTGPAQAAPAAPARTDPRPPTDLATHAPLSGKQVPGLSGAALRRSIPAAVSDRFMEMNGPRHGYPGAKKTATRTRLSDTQHLFWAAAPKQTVYGASAVHSVNPSINLSAGNPDIIYAPTLDPSALTCIEMTTAYWGGGGKGVYAWDWCAAQPGWRQGIAMDANFLATYTRDSMGFPAYQVRDVQTDAATNRWTSYLFNYNTNSWDTFYSSANTSKLSESGGGWDAFEPYTNTNPNTGEGYYCTETRGSLWFVGGLQYQLTSGGAWSSATSANSTIPAPSTLDPNYGGCNNPSLQFTVNTPNSTYWVSND